MKLALQIALGIVLASLVMFAVGVAYVKYEARVVAEKVNQIANEFVQEIEAREEARRLEQQKQRRSEQNASAIAITKEERLAEIARQREEFERIRRQAFDSDYEAPEGCDRFRSDKHMAECVNHKLISRREFFANYKPSEVDGGPVNHGTIGFSTSDDIAD